MPPMFSGGIRHFFEQIYSEGSPLLAALPNKPYKTVEGDARQALEQRVDQAKRIVQALEAALNPILGNKVFIGHGRSLEWLKLKDFIREEFRLPCDEFNVEPVAGVSTAQRIETMVSQAAIAFIVMTAEEKHADGAVYARPNVIHESGLFQGKLGNLRAIILLEEGCADFSNISGLTQIRFPRDDISARFEKIRGVLKREGLTA
jgi:predicted nucleotide-binding protein